ncbi:hypothetical protein Tco_1558720, partial [Tanacetum coccineum]
MANKTVGNRVGPGKVNITPAGKTKVPAPVPIGRQNRPIPVPTGRQNRPILIPSDRGDSPSVTSGWWQIDTLENWKEHESGDDEGFAPKEYGMVAGCGAACEEGAAEVYSLITGNGTDAAAREFALIGMTSE